MYKLLKIKFMQHQNMLSLLGILNFSSRWFFKFDIKKAHQITHFMQIDKQEEFYICNKLKYGI